MTDKTDHNHLSAGNGDEAAAKLINQYLGMSDIDAEDAAYFRAVMRDTINEPQPVPTLDDESVEHLRAEVAAQDPQAGFSDQDRASLSLTRPERARQEPTK